MPKPKLTILDYLNKLAATSTRDGKLALLRKAAMDHDHFTKVVLYALDPYRRYHVRPKKFKLPKAKVKYEWNAVFRILDRLADRLLTGKQAKEQVEVLLTDTDEGEIVYRILHKDLRCGVGRETANAAFTDLIPEFRLQLCKSYEEKRGVGKKFPIFGEVKQNGMRVVAIVRDGEVEYLSRGGRPVATMEHCTPMILKMLPTKRLEGYVLDGEARSEVEGLENAISDVKRDVAKADRLPVYHIFDMLNGREWREQVCVRAYRSRRKLLEEAYDRIPPVGRKFVRLTPTVELNSASEVTALYNRARKAGLEGIVLKPPHGYYTFGRSADWMKMKNAETTDVVITGSIVGRGKYVGQLGALTFMMGSEECRVGGGFTDEDRVRLWKRRTKLIGLTMEIEFTDKMSSGKTQHARFMRLREHKGERE